MREIGIRIRERKLKLFQVTNRPELYPDLRSVLFIYFQNLWLPSETGQHPVCSGDRRHQPQTDVSSFFCFCSFVFAHFVVRVCNDLYKGNCGDKQSGADELDQTEQDYKSK